MEDNNVMNNPDVANTEATAPPAEPTKTPEQTEAEKKKAFEEEEAKRKAEFDAKKAKRDEEIQIEWELNLMVTPEELFANAKSILSKDIERITQKTMKECVGAHIINASQHNEIIAQHVVHLVVAELLLEVADGGLLVDLDVLDAYDLSEIFPVLLVDVV